MKIYAQFFPVFPGATVPSLDNWGHGNRSSHGLYGAHVATGGFVRSFIRYADFDQYHLFVPAAILQSEADLREKILGKLSGDSRIQLKTFEEFIDNDSIPPIDYRAIHHSEGLKFLSHLSLRNQRNDCQAPITAVTHSIGYQSLLSELALLLMAGPRPWDSIVCTSECGRKALHNLIQHVVENLHRETGAAIQYDGRLDVIPLGTDTERYQPRDRLRLRRLLELPVNNLILLWFGRFSAHDKADLQPLLIAFRRACDALHEKKPILLLVGEDVRRGYADSLAKFAADIGLADNVLIRKNPPIASGPLYFSASDIFICPSDNIQETFGQTIIEAMASGLPVICSDWDGFKDTVVQNKVGFRIPTYWARCDSKLCNSAMISPWPLDHFYLSQSVCVDVDQMAEAIITLSKNDQLRLEMGEAARKHAVNSYEWRIIIKKYEHLWDTLHSLAASAPSHFNRRSAWLRPSYFSHFKGYASAILAPSMTLKATEDMVGLPEIRKSLFPLRSDLTESILDQAKEETSVEQLQACGAQIRFSREEVMWHITRLLKYGCLSLAQNSREKFLAK